MNEFVQCPKCHSCMVSKYLSENLYWYCPVCGYVPSYTTTTSTATNTDIERLSFSNHT